MDNTNSQTNPYILLPSAFGTLGIVWQRTETEPKVQRIVLPNERTTAEALIHRAFAGANPQSCPSIAELGDRIQRFLEGQSIDFDLGIIAFERCSAFQKRVLLAESKIPRGWVSTYGRIARHLGVPRGARAVGGALAHNPFPIVIPCHRAIRSGGQLGGFQGGPKMKRALLELEDIEISPAGKVQTPRIYYEP